MEGQFEQKLLHFAAALSDVYKDEYEKEGVTLSRLELKEDELTEDFTAMIYAQWALYKGVTGDNVDILEFTHIINRLVFQQIMKDNNVPLN